MEDLEDGLVAAAVPPVLDHLRARVHVEVVGQRPCRGQGRQSVALAESGINEAATAGESEDEETEEDDEEETGSRSAKKSEPVSVSVRSASSASGRPTKQRGGRR